MALKPIVGEIKAQVLNDNFSYVRQLAEEAGTDPELEQRVDALETELVSHKAESAKKHIHESGTNANGSYIRFDDGTQLCTSTANISGNIGTDGMPFQQSFPASFIDNNVACSFSVQGLGGSEMAALFSNVVIFSSNNRWLLRDGTVPQRQINGINVNFYAIGRWK